QDFSPFWQQYAQSRQYLTESWGRVQTGNAKENLRLLLKSANAICSVHCRKPIKSSFGHVTEKSVADIVCKGGYAEQHLFGKGDRFLRRQALADGQRASITSD